LRSSLKAVSASGLAAGTRASFLNLLIVSRDIQTEETMEIIRRAPDFAVINNETHDVHLIEVKYMKHPSTK
jgi:hypothetical protein